MLKFSDFTYIIPQRMSSTDPCRLRNLQLTVKWIKYCAPDMPIIIVEQDDHQITPQIEGTNHVFIKDGGLFSRGWCKNIGAREAKTPYLIFGDSDMLISKLALSTLLHVMENKKAVKPFAGLNLFYLNEEVSQKLYGDILQFDDSDAFIKSLSPDSYTKTHDVVPFAGGALAVSKKVLNIVGGWEEFRGWGGEDDSLSFKLRKLIGELNSMVCSAVHLNHSQENKVDLTAYNKNKHVWTFIVDSTITDLTRYVEMNKDFIGNDTTPHSAPKIPEVTILPMPPS